MNDEEKDDFLNDATLSTASQWEAASGNALSMDEQYELNDLLTAFFQGK